MPEITITTLIILTFTAFVAGFADSIAGGGATITIPALLSFGIPPLDAIGTNKVQSCFGSLSSTLYFYKKGNLRIKENIPFIISVFIFSAFGTIAVQFCNTEFLEKFIPLFLIIFACYFLFSPNINEESAKARIGKTALMFVLGGIGFYDGFFGPGTGSFLMIAMIALGGFPLIKSLAHAKLFNFTTNIASLIFFALGGYIILPVGLCMALGQFIGANLGSRVALRYGVKVIKPLIVIVSLTMCVKLLLKQYF